MPSAPLKLVSALCLTVLCSCGSYKGTWPRLGPTTQEASAIAAGADTVEAPTMTALQDLSPQARGTLDTINAELAQVAANYADLRQRVTLQIRSVSAALSKAGDRAGSGWSLAQLELSRLSQIETQLRAARSDAAGVAANLASFSAKGLDVSQTVARTGTLINNIDSALEDADTARQSARNRLSS